MARTRETSIVSSRSDTGRSFAQFDACKWAKNSASEFFRTINTIFKIFNTKFKKSDRLTSIDQISDDSGVQLTFDDLREQTIRAALNLRLRGYTEGQVFTVMAKNSEHLASIVIAAFCIGCPISPLATSFGKNEIIHMLNITKPSLIFCDVDCHDRLVESLQAVGNPAKIITFNGKVGESEHVEDLFVATGTESSFV